MMNPRSKTRPGARRIPRAAAPAGLEGRILLLRGQRVMLDSTLAGLYGAGTKVLNLAVRRNRGRFPADFMFRLTLREFRGLRFQFETSNLPEVGAPSQRGGRRYRPYVFTEHGVAMLSSVLRSRRAVRVNIEIMRAFVRLRRILASHRDLVQKIDQLEHRYDARFRVVFAAIRRLMAPPHPPRQRIGF